MQVYNTDQVVCFDVDDTLIMWGLKDPSRWIAINDPYINGLINCVTPHELHIQLVKKYKARGCTVIVWSAGGVKWAHSVVKALKLEEYVDAVFTKPAKYVDDLNVNEWFGTKVYLPFK